MQSLPVRPCASVLSAFVTSRNSLSCTEPCLPWHCHLCAAVPQSCGDHQRSFQDTKKRPARHHCHGRAIHCASDLLANINPCAKHSPCNPGSSGIELRHTRKPASVPAKTLYPGTFRASEAASIELPNQPNQHNPPGYEVISTSLL